jgi:hypothetical protein
VSAPGSAEAGSLGSEAVEQDSPAALPKPKQRAVPAGAKSDTTLTSVTQQEATWLTHIVATIKRAERACGGSPRPNQFARKRANVAEANPIVLRITGEETKAIEANRPASHTVTSRGRRFSPQNAAKLSLLKA